MRVAILLAVAACGARASRGPVSAPPRGDRQIAITLFRDAALVQERWRVPLAGGAGTVEIPVDAGLAIGDLAIVDTGGARLVGLTLRATRPAPGDTVTVGGAAGELVLDDCAFYPDFEAFRPRCGHMLAMRTPDGEVHVVDAGGVVEYKAGDVRSAHAEVTLEGTGSAWVELVYTTPRITWSAGYALIGDGERAILDGAVAIENTSGLSLPAAHVTVLDESIAPARRRVATDLARDLLGKDASPAPAGRDLGHVDIGRGETRLAVAAARTLALSEVLVFDPIGNRYDNAGRRPQMAREYAVDAPTVTTVLRSFEIELDARARAGLPAGPVRLFGRGDRGELVPLGAGRLFDRAQLQAKTATIAVGRASDVTARRQRTDFFLDEEGARLIEEFTITITNHGKRPAKVLCREHLYRGESWKLVYTSVVLNEDEHKEGPQQVIIPITVAPESEGRVVYRVAYIWGDE
jgi:hypothetical protein